MNEIRRGTMEMTAAMLISGTIGWFVLMSGQPVTGVVFWRCLFGAMTLLVVCAVMGLLWLSTVAPTNGIIALIFGTRWLATLAGVAFFSHQVGGFLGVWLGGVVFVRTGSYDAVWWLSVLFGLLSAVINLPIVEKPVVRAAAVPA